MEEGLRSPGAGGGRALTPDDLLSLEELGEASLSPDGRWLAYVVRRARSTATFHKHDFLAGGDRADIWLVDTVGGIPQNLTGGAGDGSGYWAPSWSPDSMRLAMLSTNGDNVHLWGCDIASRHPQRLSESGVDLSSAAVPGVWASDREILVATLPDGARPTRMVVEIQAPQIAMREWPKAWSGHECTASVLDSGVPDAADERSLGELVLVDAVGGRQQTVMRGVFRGLRVAPGGRHVAFLRQVGVRRPHAHEALELASPERLALGIVAVDGTVGADAIEEIGDAVGASLRWSPDGAEVAVIGRDGASRVVYRYRLRDGHVEPVTDMSLEPTAIVWAAGGRILVLAERASDTPAQEVKRGDWWLMGGGREPVNLTAELSVVPAQLVPEAGRRTFVGVAAGDVVRISIAPARCDNLTERLAAKITGLVWPVRRVSDDESFAQLLLSVDQEAGPAWHALDLRSGELSCLPSPAGDGRLMDFLPEHAIAAAVTVDRAGARLSISRPAFEQPRAIVELNSWLRDIAEGEIRRVDYQGLDGNALKGWLILPIGYELGRRYPLITWVYPGQVYARERAPMRMLSVAGHHALNPQLLAARGYAVLLPSMPLKPDGEPSDPCLELTNGVLPALDEAIEMGIADPDRLGLIGQSYGGYGAYGLITQTPRFQAAIALAGIADLVSLYGQFDPRMRYESNPHEQLIQMFLAECGQLRMGGPPWQETERYVRNSPVMHADRVQTPLLIIQGDMDYVPLAQGEQFFSALYRQGKRARFVRYWGEGHVFQSPANIRDMWEQIYRWLDQALMPSRSGDE